MDEHTPTSPCLKRYKEERLKTLQGILTNSVRNMLQSRLYKLQLQQIPKHTSISCPRAYYKHFTFGPSDRLVVNNRPVVNNDVCAADFEDCTIPFIGNCNNFHFSRTR